MRNNSQLTMMPEDDPPPEPQQSDPPAQLPEAVQAQQQPPLPRSTRPSVLLSPVITFKTKRTYYVRLRYFATLFWATNFVALSRQRRAAWPIASPLGRRRRSPVFSARTVCNYAWPTAYRYV